MDTMTITAPAPTPAPISPTDTTATETETETALEVSAVESPTPDVEVDSSTVEAAEPKAEPSTWETIELKADELEDVLEHLVHEGTVRRITVKKGTEVVAEFPLALGVVGAVLAAPLAAVAAIAALISDCTIEVQRAEPLPTDAVGVPESSEPERRDPA
jgi:hypothetical protein